MKFQVLCCAAVALSTSAPTFALQLHVSPNGNDAWSGIAKANVAKTNGPFKTIQRAQLRARQIVATGLKEPLKITLAPGTYWVPDGLQFSSLDSNHDKHAVIYEGSPDADTSLLGGQVVANWKQIRPNIWQSAMPSKADAQQLFRNGVRMELARTPNVGAPNAGYLEMDEPVTEAKKQAIRYRVGQFDPSNWDISNASVYSWPGHNWFSNEERIESIEGQTRVILKAKASGYEMQSGNRFFVRNVPQLLDAPNECVLDWKNRAILVFSKDDPNKANFMASSAPQVLAVTGTIAEPVRNLQFRHLRLAIANGDVVKFQNANDSGVKFCRIEGGKESGVQVLGASRRIQIYGNEITQHGLHGVSLNGGSVGGPNHSGEHSIENNHIHHCGRLVGHGYGVEISQSEKNRVTHNHIHDLPRYATTIKGLRYQSLRTTLPNVTWENHYDFLHSRNNLLAFNHIHHTNQDSQDTGAMESWGPGRDNVYDHNLIHDSGNDRFDLQSGMYLDDASDYFTLTNNIIYNVRGTDGDQPIFAKGVHNVIRNNIMVVHGTNRSAIRSLFMADERADNHEYSRNIIVFEKPDDKARGALGRGVAELHPVGKTLTWNVTVPNSGEYDIWMRYGAVNKPYGSASMDNRTHFTFGTQQVNLTNLPDTKNWGDYQWSKTGRVKLEKGTFKTVWKNEKGGGLNWDAWVLSSDPNWQPDGTSLPTTKGTIVKVETEDSLEERSKNERANVYDFNNWSDDRVSKAESNLLWNWGKPVALKGSPANDDWAKWRALSGGKFDQNSVIADPQFVDFAKRDFRLKATSPALKLGFQPIQIDKIGLKADFPKRFARK